MNYRVLITDHPAATVDVERAVFDTAGVEMVVAESTDPATLAALAADVDAIATCFAKVPAAVLDNAPRCRTVARFGVGVDNIDVARAGELGIVVTNVPVYCVDEVADHTLMLLLALARRLVSFAADTAAGSWNRGFAPVPIRLRGKTFGIIGVGAIGSALIPRVAALGMDVLALRRRGGEVEGATAVSSLDELLTAADVVSLHLPLNAATRHLIGARELGLMKPTALLLNTSRGGLVDTAALTAALSEGRLAGAGLDVTEPEPLPADHALRRMDNAVLTPHYAFSSDGSTADLSRAAAQHVLDVLAGRRPDSIVNPEVLTSPALRTPELA
ncbi:C-terminal binding protein [Nocardia goodfellowii]|uniref:D-3-phosphoglycerate dehydrogenase n=1 Tax=Nocardia goodfellowii TaxID=882446 RepID=A0ABS4QHP1_9NOCA|nr:C-terminal binding protein [Nocardia goodfellowii]MBP2191170.1 D-3-phosphoglycerate dehydrogenase [Nocardia goodfellowii]